MYTHRKITAITVLKEKLSENTREYRTMNFPMDSSFVEVTLNQS